MNIELHLRKAIQQAFQALFNISFPIEDIQLQPIRKEFEGTHTFVTFSFVEACKLTPEILANQIGTWLQQHTDLLAKFNVIKGFLNILIKDKIWLDQFSFMYQANKFGYLPPNGQKIVVEFSSPNTNKPLHLGHLRNNFLGHSLSQILQAAGYEVYKVNLVNDRGIHICKSMVAYQNWGGGETPETAGMKGDQLVGKYYVMFDQAYKAQINELIQSVGDPEYAAKQAPILHEAQEMLKSWEAGDREVLALWEKMNSWVYKGFEDTYKKLAITFDKVYYESETYLLGKEVVAEGLAKGVFYTKPDGSVWIDLAQDGLDEKLLLRSDGTAVYITQDMGTADLRYQDFKPDKLIYVVGNEQDYHFEVLAKIMQRLGRPYAADMYHLSYGMVDLPTGKMKSREGTVVDADTLIQEMENTAEQHTKELGKIDEFSESEAKELYHVLAMGALKYFLLRVDAKKRLLFDPQASIDFQGDTGPLIQYTHARIAAVLRKAQQANIQFKDAQVDNTLCLNPLEREVIVQLNAFPQKLEEAATTYAPSILAQHVLEIAKAYNRMYAELSILHEPDTKVKLFRLQLSALVATSIQTIMKLLGIVVPDRM